MNTILITGATGQLGSEVAALVAKRAGASSVAALVRDPSKAETKLPAGLDLRVGDYDDYDSLVKAFAGVNKLYFVSSSDVAHRVKQHQNVVKAAQEAGVSHVMYTSFQRQNETDSSPIAAVAEAHLKTEAWLKASGLSYTILKHTLYTDLIPMFIGEDVLDRGVIYQPAGQGKAAFLLRHDMAEAGAAVLTTEGHENKEYVIAANQAYSYADIASILSDITGKDISYVSPSKEEFTNTLSEQGVPDEIIGMSVGFAEAIKQGEFEGTSSAVETLTGRQPTSLPEYLKSVYTT